MSDAGLGKAELLEWASSRTGNKLESLEYLRSGNVFLQLMQRENPKAGIVSEQVVINPATKRDVLQNYAVLREALGRWPGESTGMSKLCTRGEVMGKRECLQFLYLLHQQCHAKPAMRQGLTQLKSKRRTVKSAGPSRTEPVPATSQTERTTSRPNSSGAVRDHQADCLNPPRPLDLSHCSQSSSVRSSWDRSRPQDGQCASPAQLIKSQRRGSAGSDHIRGSAGSDHIRGSAGSEQALPANAVRLSISSRPPQLQDRNVLLLQAVCRGFSVRTRVERLGAIQEYGATAVQAAWRGYATRKLSLDTRVYRQMLRTETARQQAAEVEAERKAVEDAAARVAADEEAAKVAADEEAALEKAAALKEARRLRQAAEEAERKAAEEIERKAAVEEEARAAAEQQQAARKAAEIAERKAAEEEAVRVAVEEEAAKAAAEEAARKAAEEAERKALEAEAARVAAKKEAARVAAEEKEAARVAAEEAERKVAEEIERKAAAKAAAIVAAEEEAARLAAQEAAALVAAEEAARVAAEEAAALVAAEEEAARVAAALVAAEEEAARLAAAEEAARLADMREAARKADLTEQIADRRSAEQRSSNNLVNDVVRAAAAEELLATRAAEDEALEQAAAAEEEAAREAAEMDFINQKRVKAQVRAKQQVAKLSRMMDVVVASHRRMACKRAVERFLVQWSRDRRRKFRAARIVNAVSSVRGSLSFQSTTLKDAVHSLHATAQKGMQEQALRQAAAAEEQDAAKEALERASARQAAQEEEDMLQAQEAAEREVELELTKKATEEAAAAVKAELRAIEEKAARKFAEDAARKHSKDVAEKKAAAAAAEDVAKREAAIQAAEHEALRRATAKKAAEDDAQRTAEEQEAKKARAQLHVVVDKRNGSATNDLFSPQRTSFGSPSWAIASPVAGGAEDEEARMAEEELLSRMVAEEEAALRAAEEEVAAHEVAQKAAEHEAARAAAVKRAEHEAARVAAVKKAAEDNARRATEDESRAEFKARAAAARKVSEETAAKKDAADARTVRLKQAAEEADRANAQEAARALRMDQLAQKMAMSAEDEGDDWAAEEEEEKRLLAEMTDEADLWASKPPQQAQLRVIVNDRDCPSTDGPFSPERNLPSWAHPELGSMMSSPTREADVEPVYSPAQRISGATWRVQSEFDQEEDRDEYDEGEPQSFWERDRSDGRWGEEQEEPVYSPAQQTAGATWLVHEETEYPEEPAHGGLEYGKARYADETDEEGLEDYRDEQSQYSVRRDEDAARQQSTTHDSPRRTRDGASARPAFAEPSEATSPTMRQARNPRSRIADSMAIGLLVDSLDFQRDDQSYGQPVQAQQHDPPVRNEISEGTDTFATALLKQQQQQIIAVPPPDHTRIPVMTQPLSVIQNRADQEEAARKKRMEIGNMALQQLLKRGSNPSPQQSPEEPLPRSTRPAISDSIRDLASGLAWNTTDDSQPHSAVVSSRPALRTARMVDEPPDSDSRPMSHRSDRSHRSTLSDRSHRSTLSDRSRATSSSDATEAAPVMGDPVKRSNAKLIRNALQYVCLAGPTKKQALQETLQMLDTKKNAGHYMVLFASDKNLIFRGLYELDATMETAFKVHGKGPPSVSAAKVYRFFGFSSAAKSFSPVQTSSYGYTVYAFALPPSMRNQPSRK